MPLKSLELSGALLQKGLHLDLFEGMSSASASRESGLLKTRQEKTSPCPAAPPSSSASPSPCPAAPPPRLALAPRLLLRLSLLKLLLSLLLLRLWLRLRLLLLLLFLSLFRFILFFFLLFSSFWFYYSKALAPPGPRGLVACRCLDGLGKICGFFERAYVFRDLSGSTSYLSR